MTEKERLAERARIQRQWAARNRERSRELARQSYSRHRAERVAHQKRRRHERIAFLMNLKRDGCVRCDFNDPRAMHFHHRNPSEKAFSIATKGRVVAMDRLLTEIAKCDVLCANCHAIAHADRRIAA